METQTTQSSSLEEKQIIEQELLTMTSHYGSFFARVGLKRIDGAIFGLLTLSKRPISSEEIESILGLSQSAVSQSLKTLTIYSMIETIEHKDHKRLKIHYVKEDAMSIVSSVIRKRELEYLNEFEKMNQKVLELIHDEKRVKRINSILLTTKFAKTLAEFIIDLTDKYENPSLVVEKIPQMLNMVKSNLTTLSNTKEKIQAHFFSKIGELLNTKDSTNGELK